MQPTAELLLLAPLIVCGTFVIFGITGFGSTVIAVPLLAHLLPLKFVLPLFVLLDLAAALRTGVKYRTEIARNELAFLFPFMFVGMAAGVFLLIRLPTDTILLALGVFVGVYGLYAASGREAALRLARGWAAPFGLIGGIITALFGAGGPLYVMYLAARGLSASQTRSTMSAVFIVSTVARIALFAVSGLYAQDGIFRTALALMPAMLIGLWIGHKLHVNLPRARLMQVLGGLLVLSGGSLVVRALA